MMLDSPGHGGCYLSSKLNFHLPVYQLGYGILQGLRNVVFEYLQLGRAITRIAMSVDDDEEMQAGVVFA